MPAMVVVGRVDVRCIEGEIVCIMNMRIGPRRPSEPGDAGLIKTTAIDINVPAANEIKGRFGDIIALPVRSSASHTTAINYDVGLFEDKTVKIVIVNKRKPGHFLDAMRRS